MVEDERPEEDKVDELARRVLRQMEVVEKELEEARRILATVALEILGREKPQ